MFNLHLRFSRHHDDWLMEAMAFEKPRREELREISSDIYTDRVPAEPPKGEMSPHLSGSLTADACARHLNSAAVA